MKNCICSLVSERCVVLAAGLINLGIMFMNPDPRAGPCPGGGEEREETCFYKVLEKCKTITSWIFPFLFSLEYRISETSSPLQMSRGLVLLNSSIFFSVISKHNIFGSINLSATGFRVFNQYHNILALFTCISICYCSLLETGY